MIKIKDLEQKYADFYIEEKMLQKLLHRPEDKLFSELAIGDVYYFLDEYNNITCVKWDNSETDKRRMNCGCAFTSLSSAQGEASRRKLEGVFRKYGATREYNVHKEQFVVVVKHTEEDTSCLFVSTKDKNFEQHIGDTYFPSLEKAKCAVEEIGVPNLLMNGFNCFEAEEIDLC